MKNEYKFKCPHCREILSSEPNTPSVNRQSILNFVSAWVCSNCENLLQITEDS